MATDAISPTPAERAAQARALADLRLLVAMDDLFLDDAARLDERTRVEVARALHAAIGTIEAELRRQAARLLAARGATGTAEALTAGKGAAERLTRAGLLRDQPLIESLIGYARHDEIAAALPVASAMSSAIRRTITVTWEKRMAAT